MSLSEEDKQWIEAALARVEARLGAKIEESEARLGVKIEESEARLGVKIEESEARTEAKIEESEARTEAKIEESEERSAAQLERVETALLTEFHKWASPMEARVRSHNALLKALDTEFESLADRIKSIEAILKDLNK